jgi:hypothetical protein
MLSNGLAVVIDVVDIPRSGGLLKYSVGRERFASVVDKTS